MTKARLVADSANNNSINGSRIVDNSVGSPKISTIDSSKSTFIDPNVPASVPRTVESKLTDWYSLKDFGAVGNGIDDDLAAVKLALESGKAVDGGGLTYAINGTLQPTSIKGLRNATLIQIADNTTTNVTTLFINGLSNFLIEDVTINMGSNITTIYSDDGNNGILIRGADSGSGPGTTFTYAENFTLSNILVTGNGCGTGIHVRNAKRFTVVDCTVRDRISGSSPDPTNDSQNGFQFNNCGNFEVIGCNAYNLKTRLGGTPIVKWTRGFLFAEVRECSIVGCTSTLNDQCYDFSGGVEDTSPASYQGNRAFTLSGCNASDCGLFGFKFANVTHDGLVTGCVVTNTAATGFVISTQNPAFPLSNDTYRTQNLTFTGCKVVNSLNNSWAGYTSAGFYVDSSPGNLYPRNIKFVGCSVVDNQAVPTTQGGFASGTEVVETPGVDAGKDITISAKNCEVFNVVEPYSSLMQFPGVSIKGAGQESASNSTWTPLDFEASDIYDTSGLHSTVTNNDSILIKESGLYTMTATGVFAAAAGGLRKIRLTRNDAATGLEYSYAAHPTGITTISAYGVLYLKSGDIAKAEVWQDSGGNLTIEKGLSYFTLARVA